MSGRLSQNHPHPIWVSQYMGLVAATKTLWKIQRSNSPIFLTNHFLRLFVVAWGVASFYFLQRKKEVASRSFRREKRRLNKSLRICEICLTTSEIANAVISCCARFKDLFNIALTASQNITQDSSCISLLATRLKIQRILNLILWIRKAHHISRESEV